MMRPYGSVPQLAASVFVRHQYVSPWRGVLCLLFGKPWRSAIRQRVARPMLLMRQPVAFCIGARVLREINTHPKRI